MGKNAINAVLFDMDGLIFDSESLYKRSWQTAFAQQGITLSDDYYRQFIGVQDIECERQLAQERPDIDLAQFRHDKSAYFARYEQQIAFKPGFTELLSYLAQQEYPLAIVTSSARNKVQHHFSGTPYLQYFQHIITSEQVKRGKPAPDCYQLACRRLQLPPQQCLVLEDSNQGVRAALSAKCQVIMVPDMLPPQPDLLAHITQVTSLQQVITLLPHRQ